MGLMERARRRGRAEAAKSSGLPRLTHHAALGCCFFSSCYQLTRKHWMSWSNSIQDRE
jgi:hypothetical protein